MPLGRQQASLRLLLVTVHRAVHCTLCRYSVRRATLIAPSSYSIKPDEEIMVI